MRSLLILGVCAVLSAQTPAERMKADVAAMGAAVRANTAAIDALRSSGLSVMVDGKVVGTRGTINIVSSPGVIITASDDGAKITIQIHVATPQ